MSRTRTDKHTDPEVGTLTTLTNVQNSLFVPDIPYIGNWLNRRPTYTLTQRPADLEEGGSSVDDDEEKRDESIRPGVRRTFTGGTLNTITSKVDDRYYAVLPHGVSLPGWTEEEKLELNDHVRHMLHSRRSKFKRSMKGFGQYVKKRKFNPGSQTNWTNSDQLLDSLLLSTQLLSHCLVLPGYYS